MVEVYVIDSTLPEGYYTLTGRWLVTLVGNLAFEVILSTSIWGTKQYAFVNEVYIREINGEFCK